MKKASAWIAPSRREPDISASIGPRSRACTNRSRHARTTCSCFCITFRTLTDCTPARRVIQSIYDSHYEGADAVEDYVRQWKTLEHQIDEQRFSEVLHQLEYQAGQAQVWRDAVTNWFLRASGIPDAKGRVGNYPGRIEAESMTLDGYAIKDVKPWESASGGKAVECASPRCSADFSYHGRSRLATTSASNISTKAPALAFPPLRQFSIDRRMGRRCKVPIRRTKVDSSSSTRRTISGVALRKGDQIRIEGIPDGPETAAIDYVEIR